MTPSELLERATISRAANATSSTKSGASVDATAAYSTARRVRADCARAETFEAKALRTWKAQLRWQIGLNGSLTCDLEVRTHQQCCRLSLVPAVRRSTSLDGTFGAPTSEAAGSANAVTFEVTSITVTEDAPHQRTITLRLANGRVASIDLFRRHAAQHGDAIISADAASTPLVFTDLPAVLGLRGGTYALTSVSTTRD